MLDSKITTIGSLSKGQFRGWIVGDKTLIPASPNRAMRRSEKKESRNGKEKQATKNP